LEEGNGEVRIIGEPTKIQNGDAVLVPAGARHNVINTGGEPLRLYILYAPLNTATEPCTRQRPRPSERKSTSTGRRPNLDDTKIARAADARFVGLISI